MSIYVDIYAEGLLNGQWESICMYGRDYEHPGSMKPIPVISGMSSIRSAIRWYACDKPVDCKSLSPQLKLIAQTIKESDTRVIDGAWFADKNFDVPEFCGYFPKQMVSAMQTDTELEIDTSAILSAEEFRGMNCEEQKAYQYFEYTEPYGYHDVMRRIQRSLKNHMEIHNQVLRTFDLKTRKYVPNSLDWDDIRAIILIS